MGLGGNIGDDASNGTEHALAALFAIVEPQLRGRSDATALAILASIFVMVGFSFVYLVTSSSAQETEKAQPGPWGSLPGTAASLGGGRPLLGTPPGAGGYSTFERTLGSRLDLSPASTLPGDESRSLPQIYPPLVMPSVHARLVIPSDPLSQRTFELAVLGASGKALLQVQMLEKPGGLRCMEVSLPFVSTRVAVITSSLQLLSGEEKAFGTLERHAVDRYSFKDTAGSSRASLVPGANAEEIRMLATPSSRAETQCAAITHHRGDPAPYYELAVSPGVDAVFALSCFLALIVFALPQNA